MGFFEELFSGEQAAELPPPGGVQLLRSVKEGKLSDIENMLRSGAVDVNFQNHYGDSALILACWYGHVDIARSLIESKADVDMVNCDGNGALNCAAYHGFVNVASLLLQNGATVDVEDKVTGKTALIKAAYVGHAQVAQMLLKRGANKDIADNQGYTALAFATSFNHTSVVQAPTAAPRRRPCHDLRLISPAPRAGAARGAGRSQRTGRVRHHAAHPRRRTVRDGLTLAGSKPWVRPPHLHVRRTPRSCPVSAQRLFGRRAAAVAGGGQGDADGHGRQDCHRVC